MRRPFGMIWVGRWRLPRCQATRTRCRGSAPRISSSGSAAATTSISRPSSSTSASPPRSATAFSRSSRNSSPRVPVIAIRRRCRSSKSSTTVSAAACVQRCWPRTVVARIMAAFSFDAFSSREPVPTSLENAFLELLHLAVADDLDHRRRRLHLRGILPPYLHVRRLAMRIEVVAGLPALHHHVQVGIVHTDMAFIGEAALLLERLGDAGLVSLDEVVLVFRLHRRGGDNVDHELFSLVSSWLANVDLFGRDHFYLRRRAHAFHRNTAEGFHVLGAAMGHQRL